MILRAQLGELLRAVVESPFVLHSLVVDLGILEHLLLVLNGHSATGAFHMLLMKEIVP